jgi:XTP/dITP diphosphohydrolase
MREILIATGNPGKMREIIAVLSEAHAIAAAVRWVGVKDIGLHIEEPVEDGASFLDNAVLKAQYYARAIGRWTLADDSGLEVDALGGRPGVLSARYAGVTDGPREEIDRANNQRLIRELAGIPPEQRTARFRCVLALSDGRNVLATTDGSIEGLIVDMPRGEGGFGYDPHFLVPQLGKTTAELAAEEKNRISHRGQALRAMRERLADVLSAPPNT